MRIVFLKIFSKDVDAHFNEINCPSLPPNVKGCEETTQRKTRGLSQGELGAKVGLTADRIQKYENGARKPKLDLLRQIALALDVSVYALMDPTTSSYVNSMYTLFEMEKDYGLELDKIDGKVCITFDRHAGLYSHIEEWYLFYRLTQEKLQSAISTEEKS